MKCQELFKKILNKKFRYNKIREKMKDLENFKENIKFILILIFLTILIFFMGLFITNSIGYSVVLIYFILSFLLPMLII